MKRQQLSTNEQNFVGSSLISGRRIDLRSLNEIRDLSISFGSKYGQVMVKLGKTKVISSIQATVAQPFKDRPQEGFCRVRISLSNVSTIDIESNRKSQSDTLEIQRMIEDSYRESRVVDLESLCIIPDIWVWEIVCNVHVVDNDGNISDAANIATILSLSHFKLPQVTIKNGKAIIHTDEEKELIPLSIYHLPISVSFGLFEKGEIIIVDPCLIEEKTIEGRIIMMVNIHEEICSIRKGGGTPLTLDQILYCTKLASEKAKEISLIIDRELEKDLKLKTKQEYDNRHLISSILMKDEQTIKSSLPFPISNSLEETILDKIRNIQSLSWTNKNSTIEIEISELSKFTNLSLNLEQKKDTVQVINQKNVDKSGDEDENENENDDDFEANNNYSDDEEDENLNQRNEQFKEFIEITNILQNQNLSKKELELLNQLNSVSSSNNKTNNEKKESQEIILNNQKKIQNNEIEKINSKKNLKKNENHKPDEIDFSIAINPQFQTLKKK
ncbi:exosome complex component rrp45 [Anaeramoeba flamelloides]|uniref:Exosome complex component rrp45 n=1 Tax=Anaeramoeba flamelloides TaxID=1746091 RepID=A0ABQ8Z2N4_9EUKA|nr:exosome complex component rrp45 [Anaeramoeba flamelloides]